MSGGSVQRGWGLAEKCSAGVLLAWAVVSLFAALLAPHGEEAMLGAAFAPADGTLLLGGDYLGRDLLSRLIFGAQTTLGISFAVTLLAFLAGVSFGFAAAVAGGWVEAVLSRLDDLLLSFPAIVFALIVISAVGSSIAALIVTLAVIEAARVYRVARSAALDVLSMEFIDVARARGESRRWIIASEVLPNAMPPLVSDFGTRFTVAMLLLSALSFLGLGVQPPTADWGSMVRENLAGLQNGSVAALLPALAIFSVALSLNLLVDRRIAQSVRGISGEIVQ